MPALAGVAAGLGALRSLWTKARGRIFQPWGTDRWGCLLCLGLSYPSRRFHRFRFEEAFSRLERMQRLQRDLTSPRWRQRFRGQCRIDPELASLRKGLNQLARARRNERDRNDG